jgi:hypothetical protein
MGGNRAELVGQFRGESVLITVIAVAIALAILEFLGPGLSRALNIEFGLGSLWAPEFISSLY